MKRPVSLLLPLAALLCSCATTTLKSTWKSPDCQGPVGKIAVLALTDLGLLRQGFENRFVAQLTRGGSSATTTFGQLSLREIKQDRQTAAERIGATGAEALLVMRVVDTDSSYHEMRGPERYAPVATDFGTTGWWNYCTVGFVDMSVSYGSVQRSVVLETSLYDLKTEKRLWAGKTRTVLKETTDGVAAMDPLVEKVVTALRKDGVVR